MSKFTECRVQAWNQSTEIIDVAFRNAVDLKGGVCYGSCVEWLKRIHQMPNENTNNRLAFISAQANLIGGRQRMYESARADVKARSDDFTAAVHFQVMNRLIQIGKFGMSITFLDGGANFLELADAVLEMRKGNVVYTLTNISTLSGGHAICGKIGNEFRLFDPNFGEFVVSDDNLTRFFNDYSMVSVLTGNPYVFVNVAQVTFD